MPTGDLVTQKEAAAILIPSSTGCLGGGHLLQKLYFPKYIVNIFLLIFRIRETNFGTCSVCFYNETNYCRVRFSPLQLQGVGLRGFGSQ